MDDNAKGLKTSEHCPFHPQYLTQRVPIELITLIIAGMSERLESPVLFGKIAIYVDWKARRLREARLRHVDSG